MAGPTGLPSATSVPRRALDARTRNFRKVTLVAGPTQALELSETAAFIWKAVDDRRSVAEIAGLVATEYAVDEATARDDVVELLAELAAVGVVTY